MNFMISLWVTCLSDVLPHTYTYMREFEPNPPVKPMTLFCSSSAPHKFFGHRDVRERQAQTQQTSNNKIKFCIRRTIADFLWEIQPLIFSEDSVATIMWSLLQGLNNCKTWSQVTIKEWGLDSVIKISFPDCAWWQIKAVAKPCTLTKILGLGLKSIAFLQSLSCALSPAQLLCTI